MTKVDIISGFLGAGKTTLIKVLLKDALKDEQVVLIENEFGEIGIDGGFLKEAGIEIREMNSGCICCSLVGDFGESLKEVINKYHPDRIVIEPSGVGKLSDVIKAVEGVKEECDIFLNSHITVVDVNKCRMYLRNFGEFYENQVQHASTIILSRTDVASEAKVKKAIELIREINADAHIITTPVTQLGGVKVLEVIENDVRNLAHELEEEHHHHHDHDEHCGCGCHDHEHHHHEEHHHHHDHDEHCGCGCHDHEHHHHEEHHHHDHDEHCECGCHDHEHHHHDHDEHCTCGCHDHDHGHHHHHADEVFTSWGCETFGVYEKEEIEKIMEALGDEETYGMVLRAKGMLPDANGVWHYFDMVPEEVEIREGSPEFTGRICVIGSKMNEENLKELFRL